MVSQDPYRNEQNTHDESADKRKGHVSVGTDMQREGAGWNWDGLEALGPRWLVQLHDAPARGGSWRVVLLPWPRKTPVLPGLLVFLPSSCCAH